MAYVPTRNEIEEFLASYGEGPLGYDEGGSSIRPADISAEWLAAEAAAATSEEPFDHRWGPPFGEGVAREISASDLLAPEFTSGAGNLTQGEKDREWGWTTNVAPEGLGSFTGGSWDPSLGSPPTGGVPAAGGSGALPTALPSNLEALYEELYGGMRSDAEAAWERSTEGNTELDAARDAYLATLGGGPNLAYWDNRLSRTLAYLDQTEKDLLAGIDEMAALKRAGIAGAA